MSNCSDWGPDGDHVWHDEDTGAYTGHCSCGAVDKALYRWDKPGDDSAGFFNPYPEEPPF